MTVVIETEHGRFEGETMKAAQRALRAAEKAADKLAALKTERRKLARLRAEAQAWRIITDSLDGAKIRDNTNWTYHPIEHRFCGVKQTRDIDNPRNNLYEVETANGRGPLELYAYRIVGAVDNASGWTIAVAILDMDRTDRPAAIHSVGIEEGEVCLETIPGLTLCDFHHAE